MCIRTTLQLEAMCLPFACQDGEPLAVEGLDSQHLRLSYSLDANGTEWSQSVRIPIPQSGKPETFRFQAL
eukprot:scaffold288890_cov50-Prasinocladus_malaysianus.AAC.1